MHTLDLRLLLKIYNNIQIEYSYSITSIYRCEIINVIRFAVATIIAVAESGGPVVGPFIIYNELEPRDSGH
jgi:hypothetical protein